MLREKIRAVLPRTIAGWTVLCLGAAVDLGCFVALTCFIHAACDVGYLSASSIVAVVQIVTAVSRGVMAGSIAAVREIESEV